MALIKCRDCGHQVSKKAEACPGCGAILKSNSDFSTYIVIGGLLFLGLVFIGEVVNQATRHGSTKPESGLVMPSIGKQIVTFDEYSQIRDGMSYRQVRIIIGDEGEELSRNHMDGVPGVMESVDTVMYQWINSNGSNMNAMFQNDKLIQKAQFGLK